MYAADNGVSGAKRSFLDQNSGNRPSAGIEFGLHNMTSGQFVCIGFQLQHLRLQDDHFEQIINTCIFLCGNFHENGVTTPFFSYQSVFRQLPQNTFRICIVFVDLVDSHDDGYACSLRVIDGFDGLRHDTIVGSNHENNNIRDFCTT